MFDRCVVLNLDRREDRWRRFCRNVAEVDWPFAPPQRVSAVDGELTKPPPWWRSTPGAWGCWRSHVLAQVHAAVDGCETLMVCEDDAWFLPDVADRVKQFMRHVPADWEQVYFGGHHWLPDDPQFAPRVVNWQTLQARAVLGTWCYVVRGVGLHALRWAAEADSSILREPDFHIDRLYAALHRDRTIKAYTPWLWIVGHAAGKSDNNNEMYSANHWFLEEHTIRRMQDALWASRN